MKKWKTLSSTYLYKTKFGNVRKDTVQLPSNLVINDYYVNEYSDWVNAVVITDKNQIVLVEQYRHAAGDFFLEIPAGKIEEYETKEVGIMREVREETGYFSNKNPILLGEYFVNPAIQVNKISTYLIIEAVQSENQELDTTEDIQVKLFNFEDVQKMIHNCTITQLFTVHAFF